MYHFFAPDFLERYSAHVLSKAAPDQLAAKTTEMESLKALYTNPLGFSAVTMMEILPVGLVVALVSALILKRKTTAA